jgi:hypothetical protein
MARLSDCDASALVLGSIVLHPRAGGIVKLAGRGNGMDRMGLLISRFSVGPEPAFCIGI